MNSFELATDWQGAIDQVVLDLLAQGGLERPPVDTFRVAKSIGASVVLDSGQAGRARFKRIGGRPTIFIRPDPLPERQHWALAHELGELIAYRVFELASVDPAEVNAFVREQVANEMAGRLLLPTVWFLPAARELDGDVLALKDCFRTASHEMILLGLLRLEGWTAVTIFDNQAVTRRFANHGARPPLTELERHVWRTVHESTAPFEIIDGPLRVQGWPVHEEGWTRELLRTTYLEELDGV